MSSRSWPLIIFLLIVSVSAYVGTFIMLRTPVEVAQKAGLSVIHLPRNDRSENAPVIISVTVNHDSLPSAKPRVTLYFKQDREGRVYQRRDMVRLAGTDSYQQWLPGQSKGKKTFYIVEAESAGGIKLTLPEGGDNEEAPFFIRWVGKTARWLLYSHILFMVGAFLVIMHAFYYALAHLFTGNFHRSLYPLVLWGTGLFFIAGIPLGLAVAYQAFGVAWGGIPYGTDITDNKTLITLLYWIVIMVLFKGNPFCFAKERSFLIGPRSFSWLVLAGCALTVTVFLIPHSI